MLRKVVDHPAFQPTKYVSHFKERTVHVIMNNDTQEVIWSSSDQDDAYNWGHVIANTLEIDAAIITVSLDY
jgi:hypothetical protein